MSLGAKADSGREERDFKIANMYRDNAEVVVCITAEAYVNQKVWWNRGGDVCVCGVM